MGKQSLVCPVSLDKQDRERILNEAESFASYLKLSKKESIQMRLITEELLGLTDTVLGEESGSFWIEDKDSEYELHLQAEAVIGERSNAMLINASTDKKNSAYKGFSGKLRQVYDIITNKDAGAYAPLMDAALAGGDITYGFGYAGDTSEWTYGRFREEIEREKIIDAWDGMEYSVLSRLADDIIVGIRNDKAEITVKVKKS